VSKKTEFLMEAFKLLKDLGDQQLPESLSVETDQASTSRKKTLFQKADLYTRILHEWMISLGKNVYELYFTAKPVPAILITRELVSQAAIFFSFVQSMEKAMQVKNFAPFERDLDRLLAGMPSGNEFGREAYIRSCLDQVGEKFSGYREAFEPLLDCVLPSKKCLTFLESGRNLRDLQPDQLVAADESSFELGVRNLVSALVILNFSLNKLNAIHPRFLEYCLA
jgi:hypothetical protein